MSKSEYCDILENIETNDDLASILRCKVGSLPSICLWNPGIQWWNVLNKAGSSTRRSEISSKVLLRHWILKFAYAGESFWERCGFQIWHDVLWAESTAIGISFP